ncbi:hypothetical protein ACYZUD_05610 [Pseudomonas sp. XS1P51]
MTIELKTGLAEVGPVYICHGAQGDRCHTLKFAGIEDSPWVNHGVSLNHATGESSLIIADPEYGDPQELKTDGAEWKLNCPVDGTDRDFEFWVQSEFTAVPYKIPMRLGHYRREIQARRAPIGAPVKGDQVTAEITVGSFYTKTRLEGVEVVWKIDGNTEETIPTSSSGISQFDYTFTTAGEKTITANFHSPYDDTWVEESFKVTVYEKSPWEEAKLFINGNEVQWNSDIALFRGQVNDVMVEAAPAIAKQIKLELVEDSDLNIEVSPDAWVDPVNDKFNWKVTPADGKSGRVTLVFLSLDVLLPWERRSLVLSANLADEVDEVRVGGVDYPASGIVLFRDVVQTVTLTYKPGSPLQGYPLELKGTVLTGLDPANLVVTATTPHAWTVKASTKSGTFKLDLTGANMTAGMTLPESKVLSRNLADEVDNVRVGGVDYPLSGIVLFRDVAQTVTLTYKPGSPLQGYPLELKGEVIDGLDPANLVVSTTATPHAWTVKASTKSGTFRLHLTGANMTAGMTLPKSKVLSRNLADEVDNVRVGGVDYPLSGIVLFRDLPQSITLTYKPGSPLQGYPLELKGTVLTGLDATNLVVTATTPHAWTVKAITKSGTFRLDLTGTNMTAGIRLPVSKVLSLNLADEVVVKIGAADIPAEGNVFFRGQAQVVTLTPKPGSPIAGYPVTLKRTVNSPLLLTDVISVPAFDVAQTEHKWSVTGSNRSGTFQLSLVGAGMTIPIMVARSTLLSTTLADEMLLEFEGAPLTPPAFPSRGGTYRVTLKPKGSSPIAGKQVTLEFKAPPTGLGVTLSPGNSQPLLPAGANWTLVCGNLKDGDFIVVAKVAGVTVGTLEVLMKLAHNELAIALESYDVSPVFGSNAKFVAVVSSAKLPNEKIVGADVNFKFGAVAPQTKKTVAGGKAEFNVIAQPLGPIDLSVATTGGNGKTVSATGKVTVADNRLESVRMSVIWAEFVEQLIPNGGVFTPIRSRPYNFVLLDEGKIFNNNFNILCESDGALPVVGVRQPLGDITFWSFDFTRMSRDVSVTVTAPGFGGSIGVTFVYGDVTVNPVSSQEDDNTGG